MELKSLLTNGGYRMSGLSDFLGAFGAAFNPEASASVAKYRQSQALQQMAQDPMFAEEMKSNPQSALIRLMQTSPEIGGKYLADSLGSMSGYQPNRGGATGEMVDRLRKENPSLTQLQALQLVQGQARQGMTIDANGNFVNAQGIVPALAERSGATAGAQTQARNASNLEYAAPLAQSEILGKAQGTAEANLPDVIGQTENTLSLVKSLKESESLDSAVGLSSLLPTIPESPVVDFEQRLEQLKGQNFLQAYNTLKGGGQITEVEGKKATDAMARLSLKQSPKDFKQSLTDLEVVLQKGLERAKQKASGIVPSINENDLTAPQNKSYSAPPPAPNDTAGINVRGNNPAGKDRPLTEAELREYNALLAKRKQ